MNQNEGPILKPFSRAASSAILIGGRAYPHSPGNGPLVVASQLDLRLSITSATGRIENLWSEQPKS